MLFLLFSWTLIPLIVSIFNGIALLTMSDEKFNDKYNLLYIQRKENLEHNRKMQQMMEVQMVNNISQKEVKRITKTTKSVKSKT